MFKPFLFLVPCFFSFSFSINAQVSITNASLPYVQDFNSLTSTGTASTTPTGWIFLETGTGANTTYTADNGAVNSGNTYSYGVTAASERALGTLLSGSVTSIIGVQFTNNSGTAITSLNITYTGEQWRIGTLARPDRLDFQYSTDATSLSGTGTWTDQNSLDFIAPVTTGAIGALVGNNAPNKTTITFEITGLNIASGTNFWLRWTDFNATGADDGLAVDDLTISFNSTPVPPCAEPANQPTALALTATATTISGNFTAAVPAVDEYLVVRSTTSTLSASPVDGTAYTAGAALGGGTVVSVGSSTAFTATGLTPGTTYYIFVFALSSDACSAGPNYLTTAPLQNNIATLALAACTTPPALPTSLSLSPANSSVSGSFTAAAGANRYLIVRSTTATLSAAPVAGTTYSAGQAFGGGTIVTYASATNFSSPGLTPGTLYYFFVFAGNGDCSGEPFYTATSLDDNTTTLSGNGIPPNYYDAATGQTCADLKTALYNIISANTVELSYTPGVWNAYQTTDLHRNDANTATIMWDMYSDNPAGAEAYTYTFATNQCGNYSKEGDCYNREHSFPKSWFADGTPMYSDLHHLFPTDGFVNAKRSNFPYGEVSVPDWTSTNGSKLGPNTFTGYTGTVFEPRDEYKGDFARAQLYMVTRYENLVATWKNNLGADNILNGTAYPALDAWDIQLMYKWHVQDPVSQKETDRNNAIFALQNNRNPFIDHPEYAALVWQCTGLLPVTLINFNITKTNTGIKLNWLTTIETNFKKYEIERGTNGIVFETTGEVAAKNSGNYTWADNALPNSKTIFYRLKMVDSDGKFRYSKTVSVNNNFSKAVIYPNPATGSFTIQIKTPLTAKSLLQIIDITGRTVATQSINAAQNKITVATQLPAGRYFVTIKNNSEFIQESFVIIK